MPEEMVEAQTTTSAVESVDASAMPPSGDVGGTVAAPASADSPISTVDSGNTDAPAFPQEVLDRAKVYGIDEVMLSGLPPEAASRFVQNFALAYDQRIAALGREAFPAQPVQAVSAAQQPQPGPGKQEVTAKAPEAQGDFRIELPEDFDDDVKKAFSTASGKLGEHDKALKDVLSKVQTMYSHFESARREAAVASFDRMCAEVDEAVKPLVGKGNSFELKPDAPERKFRESLLAQMDALDIGYRRQGVRLEEGEVFKRALNILAAPHIQKLERERLAKEVEGKRRGTLHNPKTSTPKSPAGKTAKEVEADSLSEVASLMVEHGLADKASLNVFAAM